MQLSVRHDRSDRRAVGDRRRKGRVAARRRVPRRLDAAVGRSAGLSGHSGIRFSSAGRHVDLGRYAQVRLRPEGRLGARVARRELSAPSVFSDDRLGGRRLWLAGVDGQPLGRPDRGDVGGAAQPRARRLPCAGEGDLRDGLRHAGRGARDSGAARARQADVLLRVHLGRVRHLSRERFHAAARLVSMACGAPMRCRCA